MQAPFLSSYSSEHCSTVLKLRSNGSPSNLSCTNSVNAGNPSNGPTASFIFLKLVFGPKFYSRPMSCCDCKLSKNFLLTLYLFPSTTLRTIPRHFVDSMHQIQCFSFIQKIGFDQNTGKFNTVFSGMILMIVEYLVDVPSLEQFVTPMAIDERVQILKFSRVTMFFYSSKRWNHQDLLWIHCTNRVWQYQIPFHTISRFCSLYIHTILF